MKKIFEYILKLFSPEVFLWLVPFALILPNIILDFTEPTSGWSKVVNVLLPWGMFMLLMSLWKNIGRTFLIMFPFVFYAAFQIVLLFLYGGSVIAVDMIINVTTTNAEEATELLASLLPAMAVIFAVYIPLLIWGVVLAFSHPNISPRSRATARLSALIAIGGGMLSMGIACCCAPGYNAIYETFPANAFHNTVLAAIRISDNEGYPRTSSAFNYGATSSRPDSLREVYVMVVGETSRAGNWQLLGYERPTNPRLSRMEGVVGFSRALSESNTTHKSVPLMLTWINAKSFGDSIFSTKSVTSAFKEAGYETLFLSNQVRNHSLIEFMAEEADSTIYLYDDGMTHYDSDLADLLRQKIDGLPERKLFVVLHSYGSHFKYNDRYDNSKAVFSPFEDNTAEPSNRAQLINSYDNSIVATDAFLADVIEALDSLDCPAGMLYVADHGEDIYDDSRGRFLHASPVPTYYQLHVPVVTWMSPELRELSPMLFPAARANASRNISSSESVFDTLLQLAGLSSSYSRDYKSIVSRSYREPHRLYVNDYNHGIALKDAGLRDPDYIKLKEKKISFE